MADWLYRYEARGIQGYVLDTGRLVEIASGSALIDDFPAEVERRLGDGEILQAAAGSATILFHSEAARDRFAQWWPVVVDRIAPGLQVVQGWVEGSGNDEEIQALMAKIRRNRNQLHPAIPEAGPFLQRAARTGRPAVGRLRHKGMIDAALRAKLNKKADPLASRLGVPEQGCLKNHDEFGSSNIAVIHIDGNDIGKRVMGLKGGAKRYREFSRALSEATLAAARRAVARLVHRLRGDQDTEPKHYWFRPVVLGGDDLTILTRAQDALGFARCYLLAFEEETEKRREQLGGVLTASGGIAFIKQKAPFHAAYRLSEELCSAAKDALRTPDQPTPSALAFHRVTASAFRSLAEVRALELSTPSTVGGLTFSPYTLHKHPERATLDAFLKAGTAIKKLPRGSFREWARLAQNEPVRAERAWERLADVAEEAWWTPFTEALAELGCTHGPWRRGEAVDSYRYTPIFDLLNLSAIDAQEDWK